MTELAEAPAAERDEAITRIPHWIGGKRVDGTSGRSGPVFNPALGIQSGAVDLASVEEIDAAVRNAAEAWAAWRTVSLAKRAELFFRIRELFHAHREDLAKLLTAEHGKVLSDALGEVARGLEVIEYACGIPTLIKGEFSEQASTGIDVYSIRQPLGVVAGHHAVQLPRDGAHVDVGARDRLRQLLHPQALREGPVRVAADGRAAQGGRSARTASSTSSTATRSPSTRCSSTRASPPSRSSARPRSRGTSTRRGRSTASASRRSAARRTT